MGNYYGYARNFKSSQKEAFDNFSSAALNLFGREINGLPFRKELSSQMVLGFSGNTAVLMSQHESDFNLIQRISGFELKSDALEYVKNLHMFGYRSMQEANIFISILPGEEQKTEEYELSYAAILYKGQVNNEAPMYVVCVAPFDAKTKALSFPKAVFYCLNAEDCAYQCCKSASVVIPDTSEVEEACLNAVSIGLRDGMAVPAAREFE